jgi:hypothetical protein
MKKLILTLFSFLVFVSAYAQTGVENVGIGQWRMHVPFNNGIGIAEGNGQVFCATKYGMFSYNKSDGAIERLSRISGLSDFNVSVLDYNPSLNILVLAYDNSNIDLVLSDNSIYNIPDIDRKISWATSPSTTSPSWGFRLPILRLWHCATGPEEKGNQGYMDHRPQRLVAERERPGLRRHYVLCRHQQRYL